jgi:hypothetical protein
VEEDLMHRSRRAAAAVLLTAALSVAGVVAMPAANAGILADPEAAPPVAYTINGDDFPTACSLQRIDLATGAVTPFGAPSPDACVADLAVAPDGSVWGIGPAPTPLAPLPGELVHFDETTGDVLSATPFTGAFSDQDLRFGGLAFDAAGTMYAQLVTDEPGCDTVSVCLYTVDPATAVATFVGAPGPEFDITFLSFLAADCGTALDTVIPAFTLAGEDPAPTSWGDAGASSHDDRDALASYDGATGLLTETAHFPSEDDIVVGLDYSRADGTLYALVAPRFLPGEAGTETEATTETTEAPDAAAAADDVYAEALLVSLYTVDPASGALTLVAPLPDPEANMAILGIAGSCTAPAPLVLEPTFTG